jgi:ABC-type sugar transport system permease subunit
MFDYSTKICNELLKEKFKWIVIFLSVVILGLLVCYPVGILFWKSFLDNTKHFTSSNYALVFTDPGLLSSLKNSMILGISSASGSPWHLRWAGRICLLKNWSVQWFW